MDETERLNDLIARCEKAREGSRALSDEVLLCVGWIKPTGDDYWFKPGGCIFLNNKSRPDPTRSFDAAMTLIPARFVLDHVCEHWRADDGGAWKTGGATVKLAGAFGKKIQADANTPALALVIAALKSRLPHPAKGRGHPMTAPTPSEPGPKFDEPEMPELKMGVRHLGTTSDAARIQALTDAILAIDAKATPYGSGIVENGEEYVTRYIMPAGPLHRALGLIGRCAAKPAAPDVSPTGYVPVKRELLERGVDLLAAALKNLCDHKDELPVSYEILAELRALLSPAPKDEAK